MVSDNNNHNVTPSLEEGNNERDRGFPLRLLMPLAAVILFWAFLLTYYDEKIHIQVIAYAGLARAALIVLVIFASGYGLGSWCLRLLGFLPASIQKSGEGSEKTPFRALCFLSLALGMGMLGLLLLFLGFLGMLKPSVLYPVFGFLLLVGMPHYKDSLSRFPPWWRTIQQKDLGLTTLLAVSFLILMLSLYFVCTLPLPVQYDVLEYHLGSLQQSLREGSIHPQPGIFYSYLPFGMEALYAAGLVLEGEGGYLGPKMINFGLWLVLMLGMYILAGEMGFRRDWRLFGLVLLGMNPLVFNVSLDAYVEPGQMVYVASALVCWMLWMRDRQEAQVATRGWLWLSFLFWGLSLGVKYSIFGIGILPFLLVLLPYGLSQGRKPVGRGIFVQEWLICSLKGMIIIAVAFLPWMIRNVYHTGNPVFPFLSNWIGGKGVWSPEQMAFYMRVNRESAPLSWDHLRLYFFKWRVVGALYFLPILLVPLVSRRDKKGVALAVFFLCGFFLWNLFLQPPARFLVPMVPVLVIIVLIVLRRILRPGSIAVILLLPYIAFALLALQMRVVKVFNTGYVKAALFCFEQDDFLQDQLGAYWEAVERINNRFSPDAKLLFLYEARSLYIQRPVTANSVFDRSPLLQIAREQEDARGIYDELLERGYTHVLVNEIELNRLIHTYGCGDIQSVAALFQDPGANLTAFEELYGPYLFDGDYPTNRSKIRAFWALIRQDIVFERWDERGLRFYIAEIREGK